MRHGDHDAARCIELRCGQPTAYSVSADQHAHYQQGRVSRLRYAEGYHQGRVDEAAHAPVPPGIYEDDDAESPDRYLAYLRRPDSQPTAWDAEVMGLPALGGYQPGPPAHVHDRDLPCNVKCPAWPRCRACGRAAGMPTAPCHDCPDAPGRAAEANRERPGPAAPGPGIGGQGPASQRRSGVAGPATSDGGWWVPIALSSAEALMLAERIVDVLYRAAESVPMPEDTRAALHDAIARELGAEARRDPG